MGRPSVEGRPIDTPSTSDYIQQVKTFVQDNPLVMSGRRALELIQSLAVTINTRYADIRRDVEEISRTLKGKPKLVRDLNSVLPQGFVVHCPLIQHLVDINVLEYLVLDTPDGGEILSTSSLNNVPSPSSTRELRITLPLEDKWENIQKTCLNNLQWGSCLSQLLQREFEDPQIDEFYKRAVSRRQIYLAKSTGILPPSLFLHNVVRSKDIYHADCGGFADIAQATIKETQVCLKILRVYAQNDHGVKQFKAFLREVLLWSRLSHPNILPFLGAQMNEGLRFVLISPWMKNGNLRAFLKANPDHDRLKACFQISCGLRYLHDRNPPIYHRDVKAANVLVRDNLQCCLADFGLSSFGGSQRLESKSFAGEGTMHWKAPEVILAESLESFEKILDSAAADVYAYGCTVHEIYTGNHPFHNLNLAALIRAHMQKKKPELPDTASLKISGKLRELLCSCCNPASERPTMFNINSHLEAELVSRGATEPQSLNRHFLANTVDRVQVVPLTSTKYTLGKLELEKGPLLEDYVDSSNHDPPISGSHDRERGMFTPSDSPTTQVPQLAITRSVETTSGGLVTPPVENRAPVSLLTGLKPKSKEIEVTKHVEDFVYRQRDNIFVPLETPTVLPGRQPSHPSPTLLRPDSPVFVPRATIKAQTRKLSINAAEFRPTKPLRSSTLQSFTNATSSTAAATVSTPATLEDLLVRQSLQSSLNANASEFIPMRRNQYQIGDGILQGPLKMETYQQESPTFPV